MALFLAVVQAVKNKILHTGDSKKYPDGQSSNVCFQPVLSGKDAAASHWQALYERIVAANCEPCPKDEEVDALLKTVFRERMLANYPEFESYFKRDITGRALEDRLLAKATAAAEAEALAAYEATAKLGPHGAKPSRWRCWGRGWGWLQRYRCWRPRVQVYLTLTHPEYTPLALWLNVFLLAVIVLNTATFCMESVPHWNDSELYNRLVIVDYACLGIFTAEFLLRLATCNSFRRFALRVFNWIDVIAILPFYLELIVQGPGSQDAVQSRIVRLLRLLRIMRVLRATKQFRNLQIVGDALVNSLDVITMLCMLLVVLLVVSGTIVYYVEGALVPDTWFDSIPLSIYYMHTTLTTTGYGDFYAQSNWGRFVMGLFMLLCIMTLSLPIGVVSGNFSGLWSRYNAIRDSLERSAEAWGTRGRLRQLAAGSCAALDDMIGRINELKSGLEDGDDDIAGVKALHDRLGELKEGLQIASAEGEDLYLLRADVADLRQRIEEAGARYSDLQKLLSVSSRLVSPELSERLDELSNVTRKMAGLAGDGVGSAMAAREMLAELKAIRDAVAVEEVARAAAAAAGTGVNGDEQRAGTPRESGKGY